MVGTHTQDEPVGMQTQSAEVGQQSLSALATFLAVAAGLQLEPQADLLQVVLAFFGASVANEPNDTNRNRRAVNAAMMLFFMVFNK